MKASVDISDLGALEKQMPHEQDDYDKHHNSHKEVIGAYVCFLDAILPAFHCAH